MVVGLVDRRGAAVARAGQVRGVEPEHHAHALEALLHDVVEERGAAVARHADQLDAALVVRLDREHRVVGRLLPQAELARVPHVDVKRRLFGALLRTPQALVNSRSADRQTVLACHDSGNFWCLFLSIICCDLLFAFTFFFLRRRLFDA